jgi:hypothetical protein
MRSVSRSRDRSFARITPTDLNRLATIAREDLSDFFKRKKRWAPYAGRIVLVALCQGAADHYVQGKRGVHDFDVWTFFAEDPKLTAFPYRRNKPRDFRNPKFGRDPKHKHYAGRRVDLLGRSIARRGTAVESVQLYLREGKTKTARELAKKSVVVIWPPATFRRVVWRGGRPV